MEPAVILSRFQLPGLPFTYELGCYANRVTFLSQQNRALNLIWALFETNAIRPGDSIGIVGAGLAGLTAAAGASSKGCRVSIYENGAQLMPLQRGNYTRYIHPNIYDWPGADSDEINTQLPFLNWTANFTNEVVKQIENEWKEFENKLSVNFSFKVNGVTIYKGKPRITGSRVGDSFSHDCVILAVGFGIERPFPNVRYLSYWDVDSFHQPVKSINKSKPKSFFISGCGDGGLVDALRLSILDFDHLKFTHEFLANSKLQNVYEQLLEIDRNAVGDDDEISCFLMDEYKRLKVPQDLQLAISRRLRIDTVVTLNSSTPTFFSLRSCVLNRYAVFLVSLVNKIFYEQGKLQRVSSVEHGYSLEIATEQGNKSRIFECDEIIVRHGPDPVIQNFLVEGPPKPWDNDDPTRAKLWPEHFYPKIAIKKEQSDIGSDKTFDGFFEYPEVNSVSRHKDKEGREWVEISVSTEIFLRKLKREIKEINGLPVKIVLSPSINLLKGAKSSKKVLGPLSVGIGITNFDESQRTELPGIMGSLGCFVRLANGDTGFLTAYHSLGGKVGDRILRSGSNEIIGTLIDFVGVAVATEAPHFPGRVTDIAVVRLNPGIEYFAGVLEHVELVDAAPEEIMINENVSKIGAGTGRTSGVISSLAVFMKVRYGKSLIELRDVIMVKNHQSHIPFSSHGDSGALVFSDDGRAIGLILGASSQETLVCYLRLVLRHFDCRLQT